MAERILARRLIGASYKGRKGILEEIFTGCYADGTPSIAGELVGALPAAVSQLRRSNGTSEHAGLLQAVLDEIVNSAECMQQVLQVHPGFMSGLIANGIPQRTVDDASETKEWLEAHRHRLAMARAPIDDRAASHSEERAVLQAVAERVISLSKDPTLGSGVSSILQSLGASFDGKGRQPLMRSLETLEGAQSLRDSVEEALSVLGDAGDCELGLGVLTTAYRRILLRRPNVIDVVSDSERLAIGVETEALLESLPESRKDGHVAEQLGKGNRSMLGNELMLIVGLLRTKNTGATDVIDESTESMARFLEDRVVRAPTYAEQAARAFAYHARGLSDLCSGDARREFCSVVCEVQSNTPWLVHSLKVAGSPHPYLDGSLGAERRTRHRAQDTFDLGHPGLRLVKKE